MTREDIIGGVYRIPHDAIASFIERAVDLVEQCDEKGRPPDRMIVGLLDDACTNLQQLLAEWQEQRAEVARLRAEVVDERDGRIANRELLAVYMRESPRLQAECDDLLAAVQRESAWVNERNGVIAFLAGAFAEVAKSKSITTAKTIAEMVEMTLAEWHAGTWQPGPSDDPANWLEGEAGHAR
jgi:hypothetical protein